MQEVWVTAPPVTEVFEEELLEDYHDFLRVRNFTLWDKESKEASFVLIL